jgi:putative PIN family toxin of toxin-antitoxin system
MPPKSDRLVVDTNLWISFLLSSSYEQFEKILNSGKVVLLFSEELLLEFVEVATRPKFQKYFSVDDINLLLDSIDNKLEFIVVKESVEICRDGKDNFLLALAKEGKATHLLSGDKDLLEIGKFEGVKICTITEYLKD